MEARARRSEGERSGEMLPELGKLEESRPCKKPLLHRTGNPPHEEPFEQICEQIGSSKNGANGQGTVQKQMTRKIFKMCDFGLSYNSMENFPPSIGDGNYLAPEFFQTQNAESKEKVPASNSRSSLPNWTSSPSAFLWFSLSCVAFTRQRPPLGPHRQTNIQANPQGKLGSVQCLRFLAHRLRNEGGHSANAHQKPFKSTERTRTAGTVEIGTVRSSRAGLAKPLIEARKVCGTSE